MLKATIQRLCKLVALAVPLAVIVGAATGAFSPAPAQACTQTCFAESATAYSYCQRNPGGYYNGCNFSLQCGVGTSSANQIYHDYCLL